MTVSLLQIVAVILLSATSLLVLWAIRLCDIEPETPAAPAPTRRAIQDQDVEPLRRAA
jgi:hypothetical protein